MTINKGILNDYLAGKGSALQKQMIENWLKEKHNEELFYQYLIEYETVQPLYTADVDRAMARYHQFVEKLETTGQPEGIPSERTSDVGAFRPVSEPPERPFLVKSRPIWMRWSIAATVALLMMAAGWSLRHTIRYQTYSTAYGQTQAITLDDGSTVVLNANSTLGVTRFGFSSGKRQVHLEGEALFSVTHTQTNRPFVVHTDNQFDVEVLGTVFNVFARPRGGKVVLSQGRVNVLLTGSSTRKKVVLKPGQIAQIDGPKKRVRLTQTPAPEDHAAWRDNRYVFDKTTVAEIGHLLRENYGLTLTTNDNELLKLTVSGSYTASNAEELLQLLEATLGITATRQKNTVLIARRVAHHSM